MAKLRVLEDLRQFRSAPGAARGIERIFVLCLLGARVISPSYWIKTRLPSAREERRHVRDAWTEVYCVAQFAALVVLVFAFAPSRVASALAGAVIAEIVLVNTNTVFVGKFRKLQASPASIERSVLLLVLNVLEFTLGFAVFYRWALKIGPVDAIFKSSLVLGTIGYPSLRGAIQLVVSVQVFLDLMLLVLILGAFVGQLGAFATLRQPVIDERDGA